MTPTNHSRQPAIAIPTGGTSKPLGYPKALPVVRLDQDQGEFAVFDFRTYYYVWTHTAGARILCPTVVVMDAEGREVIRRQAPAPISDLRNLSDQITSKQTVVGVGAVAVVSSQRMGRPAKDPSDPRLPLMARLPRSTHMMIQDHRREGDSQADAVNRMLRVSAYLTHRHAGLVEYAESHGLLALAHLACDLVAIAEPIDPDCSAILERLRNITSPSEARQAVLNTIPGREISNPLVRDIRYACHDAAQVVMFAIAEDAAHAIHFANAAAVVVSTACADQAALEGKNRQQAYDECTERHIELIAAASAT